MENNTIELAIVEGPSSGGFSLQPTRIQIAEDMSFDQWLIGLRQIKWYYDNIDIALADWISWGTTKWGPDKVNNSLEQLEFEANFVKTATTITGIPDDIRHPQLEGQHYVELMRANLTKAQQVKWAKVAAEQLLTPMQLRISIVEGQVVDQAATKSLTTGVITPHGIRQQFDVWLNRVGGLSGVYEMDQDHQDDIMGELDKIIEFGLALREHLYGVATE